MLSGLDPGVVLSKVLQIVGEESDLSAAVLDRADHHALPCESGAEIDPAFPDADPAAASDPHSPVMEGMLRVIRLTISPD